MLTHFTSKEPSLVSIYLSKSLKYGSRDQVELSDCNLAV